MPALPHKLFLFAWLLVVAVLTCLAPLRWDAGGNRGLAALTRAVRLREDLDTRVEENQRRMRSCVR